MLKQYLGVSFFKLAFSLVSNTHTKQKKLISKIKPKSSPGANVVDVVL